MLMDIFGWDWLKISILLVGYNNIIL